MKSVTQRTTSVQHPTPLAHEVVMDLLHQHVPLALLCDLTTREAPSSREILAVEGSPVDHWWEQPAR